MFLFKKIINFLSCRYEHQEIASNCGTMLRECARYEALAKIMLYSDDFYNFFRYVEVSTFDIASDAFSTFKVCLCYIYYLLIGLIWYEASCGARAQVFNYKRNRL